MPIYEYECQECGKRFDKLVRSLSQTVEIVCPECHSKDCKKAFSVFGTTGTNSSRSSGASCAPSG